MLAKAFTALTGVGVCDVQEVGSVSVRNTQNILFKNVVSPTVSAVLFWAFGYSVAYVRSPAHFSIPCLGHSHAS